MFFETDSRGDGMSRKGRRGRIVELGSGGDEQDPCLAAFMEHYGKSGEVYPEDDWLQRCGTFVRGWNSAKGHFETNLRGGKMSYCQRCGRELERTEEAAGYLFLTGKPRVRAWYTCPEWGRLFSKHTRYYNKWETSSRR